LINNFPKMSAWIVAQAGFPDANSDVVGLVCDPQHSATSLERWNDGNLLPPRLHPVP
jgi:hypothetical protein